MKILECYVFKQNAVMAKMSLSPLYVQADTRRFGFKTFSKKERPFSDINFNSDFCPIIEIFALRKECLSGLTAY